MEIEETDVAETGEEWTDKETEEAFKTASQKLDLDKPLEKGIIGGFVNKKELVGKTIEYTTVNVSQVPNVFKPGKFKLVLQVKDKNGNDFIIDVNQENKVWLIDNFGAIPTRDWVNKKLVVKFVPFGKTDRNGVEMEGISTIFS